MGLFHPWASVPRSEETREKSRYTFRNCIWFPTNLRKLRRESLKSSKATKLQRANTKRELLFFSLPTGILYAAYNRKQG